MKKVFLQLILIFFFSSSLYAEINEYQIDLYFANGMNGEEESKEKKTWDKYVQELKKRNPILKTQYIAVKVAYNAHELWGAGDTIEVIFQKVIGDQISWLKINTAIEEYVILNNLLESYNLLS